MSRFIIFLILSHFSLAQENPRVHNTFPQTKKAVNKEEQKPSLGLFGGLSNLPDRTGGSSYGVSLQVQPWIPFSTGIVVSGNVSPKTDLQPTLTRTQILATGAYNFGGDIPVIKYSYLGLGLGAVLDNEQNGLITSFGALPNVGFDIPLDSTDKSFTLGANASYLFVGNARPQVFALNGVAKYWF